MKLSFSPSRILFAIVIVTIFYNCSCCDKRGKRCSEISNCCGTDRCNNGICEACVKIGKVVLRTYSIGHDKIKRICCEGLTYVNKGRYGVCGHCLGNGVETKFSENCCQFLYYDGKKCVKDKPCYNLGDSCIKNDWACCDGLYCNKLHDNKTLRCGKECFKLFNECDYPHKLNVYMPEYGTGGCCDNLRCATFYVGKRRDQQCFPCIESGSDQRCYNGQMCCSGVCGIGYKCIGDPLPKKYNSLAVSSIANISLFLSTLF